MRGEVVSYNGNIMSIAAKGTVSKFIPSELIVAAGRLREAGEDQQAEAHHHQGEGRPRRRISKL